MGRAAPPRVQNRCHPVTISAPVGRSVVDPVHLVTDLDAFRLGSVRSVHLAIGRDVIGQEAGLGPDDVVTR